MGLNEKYLKTTSKKRMKTLGNMFSLGFCLNEISFLKDKHYKNKSMQDEMYYHVLPLTPMHS